MSEIAKTLFDSLSAVKESVHSIAPGLKDLGPQAHAEFKRMGSHGSTEMANLLFSGNAFVLYGPGQNVPAKHEQDQQQEQTKGRDLER